MTSSKGPHFSLATPTPPHKSPPLVAVAYVLSHTTGPALYPLHPPRPTTISVARANTKCWTAHNWAKAHSLLTTGVQCCRLNSWISHWCKAGVGNPRLAWTFNIVNGFPSLGAKCWVFISQLWCKIYRILQALTTKTILHGCIPWKPVIILVQWEHATKVCNSGVNGGGARVWTSSLAS